MDKNYFANYDPTEKKSSYKHSWKERTIEPDIILGLFEKFLYKPKTFFDIGAADGSFMQWLKDDYEFNHVGGIEIYYPIVNKSKHKVSKNIIIGDVTKIPIPCNDKKLWDFCFLNGVYLSESDILKLFCQLQDVSKNIVFILQTWDCIRWIEPPYRETIIKPINYWLDFFELTGWEPVCFNNWTFILSKKSSWEKYQQLTPKQLKIKTKRNGLTFKNGKGKFVNKNKQIVLQLKCDDAQVLYSLNPFLSSLDIDIEIYTKTKMDCYIPGWENEIDKSLHFSSGWCHGL